MANPNQSKYDYLLENNQKYMDLTAVSFGKRKITYEELHDRIQKYAKILYNKGIRENDVIGVCGFNNPETIYLLYALDVIGAQVVGISPLDKKEKVKQDIELTRPKMIISLDMNYSNFRDYEKALNFSTVLYSLVDSVDDKKFKYGYKVLQVLKGNFKLSSSAYLKSLLNKDTSDIAIPHPLFDEEKATDIMFTGGSTGLHKGVDLAGCGINYVVEGMNDIFSGEPGLIHLGNIPLAHMVYGKLIMHYSLCNNFEYALTMKCMPKDFYDELVRTGANAAVGGPPHWVSLIEENENEFTPSSRLQKGSLSNLHYATSGGEAKKISTDAAINEALKYCGSDAILGDGLGSTETWATIMANNGKIHTLGTVGKPISTIDVKLINPQTGSVAKVGEPGLLYVSGPTTMLRYHNNPEESAKVISYDENGKKWINLGDYLMLMPNGEYKYVGRQKRNFVCDVENIYPEQLENLLINVPGIRDIIVTKIPDELLQFVPKYHISLENELVDIKQLEKTIKNLVNEKFGINWLPAFIEYYNEPLERMSNSKLNISAYQARDDKDYEEGKISKESIRKLRL